MTTTMGGAASPSTSFPGGHFSPPRRASRGSLAVAVLLMILGAGVAVWAARWHDDHVDAVILTRPVARGDILDASALAVARVSVEGGSARLASPATARAAIVGRQALVSLAAGTLISPEMVGSATPAPGSARVGLRLSADTLPARTLRAGDWVQVVLPTNQAQTASTDSEGGSGAPTLLGGPVQVAEVRPLTGQTASGDLVVDLEAPADQAARIAASAGGNGQGLRLLAVRR
jgi:hypothetical protein